jgi:hypothetical protein
MFRKILFSLALAALFVASFAPAHAHAAAPQSAEAALPTLSGQITALNPMGEMRVLASLAGRPISVLVNSKTVIMLNGAPINFSQLRVGDQVTITLRLSASRVLVAVKVEATR